MTAQRRIGSFLLAVAGLTGCGNLQEGHTDIFSARFLPDGKVVAFVVGAIKVFDPALERETASLPVPLEHSGAGNFHHRHAVSANGSSVAVSYFRWASPPADPGPPPAPDAAPGPLESVVAVFDLATQARVWTLTDTSDQVSASMNVALSNDGGTLAVTAYSWRAKAARSSLRIFHLPEGNLLWRAEAEEFYAPVFSPDGQTLYAATRSAVGESGSVRSVNAWRAADGMSLFSTTTARAVPNLAVAANGAVLVGGVVGPGPAAWAAWSTTDGALLREGTGTSEQDKTTEAVDVNGAGDLVLSVTGGNSRGMGYPEEIRLWHGSEVQLTIADVLIYTASFSSDAGKIVTTHGTAIKLWNASDGALIATRELPIPLR
jgi:hypothetical protein